MNRFRVECKHVNAGWIGILCRSLSRILLFIIIPYVVTGVDTRLYSFEKNAIYYSKKGGDYLSKGDNYRAILNFRNALKLNPNYHEAIIGLGNAYRNTEAYEESLKLYNNALRIDRNDFNAMIGIGSCLVALGRYSDAIKYYNHALELSEGNVEAQYGIANLYFLMNKMIWAKRGLKEILRINPYHYKSLLLLADIKNYDNRIDEARGYAQKAIDSNSELPEGYVKYGQILLSYYQKSLNNDYFNEAIDKFNKALSIHPEDINANRSMGYLSLIQEDYSGAIDYFKKSLQPGWI